jgi:hypothetical protein
MDAVTEVTLETHDLKLSLLPIARSGEICWLSVESIEVILRTLKLLQSLMIPE